MSPKMMLTTVMALTLLACGGAGGEENETATTKQAVWVTTPSMAYPRLGAKAIRMSDGRIMIVGGSSTALGIEIYNPTTDTWDLGPNLAVPHYDPALSTLKDGRIVAIGGTSGAGAAGAEIFDGAKWTTFGPTTFPRMTWARTAVLSDGTLLVVGADTSVGGTTDKTLTFTYNPTSGVWSTGKPGPAHVNGGFVHLADDTVLLAGGMALTWSIAADRYSATTNTWTSAGMPSTKRVHGTMLRIPGGAMYVGGQNATAAIASVEFWSETTNTWTDLAPMAKAKTNSAVTMLPSGFVIAAGGGTNSVEIFDPKLGKWYPTESLLKARTLAATVVLDDGSLLMAGGQTNAEGDYSYTNAVMTVVRYRQSKLGEMCTVAAECSTGTCTGGVCAAAVDAGPIDTGTPPVDTGTAPTDTGIGPVTDTGAPSTDTGIPTTTDTGTPTSDTGTTVTDTGTPSTDSETPADSGGDADSGPTSDSGVADTGINCEDEDAVAIDKNYSKCYGPPLTFDAKACQAAPGSTGGGSVLGGILVALTVLLRRRTAR